MIVANRATLSGIIRAPFLSPAGQGYSGGIHNNIRLDLSPTQLGFGRMRYRTAQRFVQDKMTALGQTRHFNYAPTTSDLPDTPAQVFIVDTFRPAWPACRRWEREYIRSMAVSSPDLTAFLLATPFFGGLSDASLDLLVSMLVERRFDVGASVVAEGEPGRSMFIVHSGGLVVSKLGDSQRIRIADLEPGDFSGEMTLIEMQNRSATVVAESPTVLYELTARELYTYYKADIHAYVIVMQNISRELCRRLRRADNRIAELQMLYPSQ